MLMVHQMLSAAMAEDGDGNDEDKEEAARKADEGIAMLKAKLEKAKADEAGNGETLAEPGPDPEPNHTESTIKKEDSHIGTHSGMEQEHEVTTAQLKAKLEDSEANVNPPQLPLKDSLSVAESDVFYLGFGVASRT